MLLQKKKLSDNGNLKFTPEELNDCFLSNNNADIDEKFIDEKIAEM